MEHEVAEDGDPALVTVRGDLFYDTVDPLRATLLELAEKPERRIVIDLTHVAICDSSGLQLLVQTYRRATAGGGWIRLAGVQPTVRRVLEITVLDRILPLYDTVSDAISGA